MEPMKATDPKAAAALAQQMSAAKLANATKVIDDLPALQEMTTRQLDMSGKLEKKNQELDLQLAAKQEKVEQLEVALQDGRQELKYATEDFENAKRQAKDWQETLEAQMQIGAPKRSWTWKRLLWAGAASCAGVAAALLFRKKAPMINAAAGGCSVANLARRTPGFKNHEMIASAAGALGTHWAHRQDNLVGLSAETVLAGAGFAELTFNLGEAVAEGTAEAVKSMKEAYKKTREEIEKEGGAR